MAKANSSNTDTAAAGAAPSEPANGVAQPVAQADAAVAPVVETPTAENTPLPGGGRWKWDITKPGWVEVT
ncbi:MAG: hypothetical protein Q8R67_12130 [Rhodoferax sp.]|nr:hypothetical protein [Rhodoferax sp.]MDP3652420.1 hypothetical protein [Rhodoferax sp.]